jgi:hypothetical protein
MAAKTLRANRLRKHKEARETALVFPSDAPLIERLSRVEGLR